MKKTELRDLIAKTNVESLESFRKALKPGSIQLKIFSLNAQLATDETKYNSRSAVTSIYGIIGDKKNYKKRYYSLMNNQLQLYHKLKEHIEVCGNGKVISAEGLLDQHEYLFYMARQQARSGLIMEAIKSLNESLSIAIAENKKELISDAYELLLKLLLESDQITRSTAVYKPYLTELEKKTVSDFSHFVSRISKLTLLDDYEDVYVFLKKRIELYKSFAPFSENVEVIKLAEARMEVSRSFRTLDFEHVASHLETMISLFVKTGVHQRYDPELWIYHYWLNFSKGNLKAAGSWIEKRAKYCLRKKINFYSTQSVYLSYLFAKLDFKKAEIEARLLIRYAQHDKNEDQLVNGKIFLAFVQLFAEERIRYELVLKLFKQRSQYLQTKGLDRQQAQMYEGIILVYFCQRKLNSAKDVMRLLSRHRYRKNHIYRETFHFCELVILILQMKLQPTGDLRVKILRKIKWYNEFCGAYPAREFLTAHYRFWIKNHSSTLKLETPVKRKGNVAV